MLDLTPGERRGALTLLVLLLIGTGHDLWLARQLPAEPPVGHAAGGAEPQGVIAPAGIPATDSVASPAPAAARVDLNRASAAELDALPGIGPVLAGRIVAHRERVGAFRSTDDLLAVPGIGPKLHARLAERVRVESGSGARSGRQ